MRVLGISGLARSAAYKRRLLGDTDPRLLRMCQGWDSAAALVENGRVVAAVAEERLNREKHSGAFPMRSIQYCLREAGVRAADVDIVALAFDYESVKDLYSLTPLGKGWYENVYSPHLVEADLGEAFGPETGARLTPVPHHLAHAASAFFASGFTRALTVVADGMGEAHGVSVFDSSQRELRHVRSVPFSDSIGILYGLITHHLGFEFNYDEYKTMGLAPYGDWKRYWPTLEGWLSLRADGSYGLEFLQDEETDLERETFEKTREAFAASLFPPRAPDAAIEQRHMDLAAGVQELTNRILCHVVEHGLRQLDHDAVCLAGGVALNCVANERVLGLPGVRRFFVQPASGDDGAALGAAMFVAARGDEIEPTTLPCWGPAPSEAELRDAYERVPAVPLVRREHVTMHDAACAVARHLADGKVVALYQGRMEFGPRALGNRSILADPRDPKMRDRVNAAVKRREGFRPFAPAVLESHLTRYFQPPAVGDFSCMLVTMPVREEFREQLPAITHVDGSARVQTVSAAQNPQLHRILEAFFDITGTPVVLNTSFNIKGQPIVHTAAAAVATFVDTGIDVLFLGRYEMAKET